MYPPGTLQYVFLPPGGPGAGRFAAGGAPDEEAAPEEAAGARTLPTESPASTPT
jgi:hypothetical protein